MDYWLNCLEPMNRGLSQWLSSKESVCEARDAGNVGLIPGLGRSPAGGHSNPLQYSCLENPMDRRVWWATVHRVTKSRTQLKQLIMHIFLRNRTQEIFLFASP